MTIESAQVKTAYAGDGTSTSFATVFKFFGPDELEVIERVIATGAETVKALTTDYVVTGGNGATGTVVAVAAPPSTVQWHIRRKTAPTQAIDYVENDAFPAETHERAIDRGAARNQEQDETLSRALTIPKTDPAAGLVFPTKTERAGKIVNFDDDGNIETLNLVVDVQTVASIAGAIVTLSEIADEIEDLGPIADEIVVVANNVTDITSFFKVWYGPSATQPTTRPDGSARQTGDLYYDTTYKLVRVFNAADGTWGAVGAGAIVRDLFDGDGTSVSFALTTTPVMADQVFAYIDGVLVASDAYGLTGNIVTFDVAPGAGTSNVEIVVFRPQTLVPDFAELADRVRQLEYQVPVVGISISPTQVEVGASQASVALTITTNRPDLPTVISGADSQTLDPGDLSGTATGPYTSDSTFTATQTDPDPPPGRDDDGTASVILRFRRKAYWGVSAAESLDTAAILAFEALGDPATGDADFATDFDRAVTYDCTGGRYFYYAYPASFGTPSDVTVGGLAYSDFTVTNQSFTNASGSATTYRVLRSGNLQNGANIQVEWK